MRAGSPFPSSDSNVIRNFDSIVWIMQSMYRVPNQRQQCERKQRVGIAVKLKGDGSDGDGRSRNGDGICERPLKL